jgi:hypothetical protein
MFLPTLDFLFGLSNVITGEGSPQQCSSIWT